MMKDRTYEALLSAHQDIGRLILTDFPDHDNVGDSAIALGELEFCERSRIEVRSSHCIGTSPGMFDADCAVALHGGGNFGGLYPDHDAYRYHLARSLPKDTVLIQEPQTVHFVSESARSEFRQRMASRYGLRILVRDQESYDTLRGDVAHLFLTPDAAHMLGEIAVPPPSKEAVFLLRRDEESRLVRSPGLESVDWPRYHGPRWMNVHLRSSIAKRMPGALAEMVNPSPKGWERIARTRLSWGISVLQAGETVVTDRLHAMILALHMGRRVIAIDNNNRKLSRYAETWFGGSDANVEFVADVSEANARL